MSPKPIAWKHQKKVKTADKAKNFGRTFALTLFVAVNLGTCLMSPAILLNAAGVWIFYFKAILTLLEQCNA